MIPRGTASLLFAATVACAAPSAEARNSEKRPARKEARIEGEVSLPEGAKVTRVSAIDRDVSAPLKAKEMPVTEYAGRVPEGGGRFEIEVPGGTYDLHVELEDGLKIDGVDMRVAAGEGARPLGERDREAITERILAMKTFENEKSVLAIEGAGELAKALVKLVRTEPTSYDGEYGEPVAIFRWEVWNFRKRTGSWVRERKSLVLRRFLVPKRKMDEVRWDFRPALGGVDVGPGATVRRDVDLGPPAAPPDDRAGGPAEGA